MKLEFHSVLAFEELKAMELCVFHILYMQA